MCFDYLHSNLLKVGDLLVNNNLLLIKEFSQLTGLSRKALYLYEQHNILNPAFIHPDNDYRYYDQNQLLAAKRIRLLKQAGLTLDEIREVIYEKLSEDEINNLIEEKTHLEMGKIKAANQAIEKLETLRHIITESNKVKKEYLESVNVFEYNLTPNENICVALNNSEEIMKQLSVKAKEKIIKYKLIDNQINPVSIALQVENEELNNFKSEIYFGIETTQFYYDIDPYQEESVVKIKEIMDDNTLELSESYVYERILNSDDYLYSSKRLSIFIFPTK
ncbi:MerR family transcriptional regulator [Metabacillus fastidiosus]|uniref:MerR family transcriptional regulator n=1 Tax=Metabacillus fastidiosus TaxID=1458 RepID=UPI002E1C5B4D|nr:MerR family transcriptional regulator [Metabacillus fastidiosus]MED4534167.1 MerR family transcriptional regulator [Metabacillus fastidiosus]